MDIPFPALTPTRLTGGERFTSSTAQTNDLTVLTFWQWAASNLVDNVTRGLVAEYLVASALGLTETVRSAWDAFDLQATSGLKIEVKSASYLQAWAHRRPSAVRFRIRSTRAWDGMTGQSASVIERQADLYVLCLLKHLDKATLSPLDLDQWEFYVVPTTLLNEKCGDLKGLSLKRLTALGVSAVPFGQLRAAVAAFAAGT